MVGRDGRKMVNAICEDTVALISSQIGGFVVRMRGNFTCPRQADGRLLAAFGRAGQCRRPSGGWQPSLNGEAPIGAALHRHDLAAAGKDLAEGRHHHLMRDEHGRPREV